MSPSRFFRLPAILLAGCLIALPAMAKNTATSLFNAYPDASLKRSSLIQYENFTFPTTGDQPSLAVVGDLSRHSWEIKSVSSLKVYENYRKAAETAGFKVVFSCEQDNCQEPDTVGGKLAIAESVYNHYRSPYYLLTQKEEAQGKVYAAWFIGSYNDSVAVQQVVVSEVALQNDLINMNSDYFKESSAAQRPQETANAKELEKDHPLIARYPGAKLEKHSLVDHERFTFLPAPQDTAQAEIAIEGDLARHVYKIANTSSLKAFENYQQALKTADFTILSSCALAQCGSESEVQSLGANASLNNNVYNYYRNPYYLLAKKDIAGSEVFISVFVGAYQSDALVQQNIVRTKALETDLVTINADTLKQQLDADGKALIYGIYFDTGKADIKEESLETLKVIGELLTRNPDLLLYVVGHTDDTGSGSLNQTLSKNRAAAVVKALVDDQKIAASRLQAEGVGPYAPVSNNTTEAGKKLNRRVELVKRLQ